MTIAYFPDRLRSVSFKRIFRIRRHSGVTSTYSSDWMYSKHSSKLNTLGGASRTLSSAPEERILVNFLVLVTCLTHTCADLAQNQILPCGATAVHCRACDRLAACEIDMTLKRGNVGAARTSVQVHVRQRRFRGCATA